MGHEFGFTLRASDLQRTLGSSSWTSMSSHLKSRVPWLVQSWHDAFSVNMPKNPHIGLRICRARIHWVHNL